MMIFLFMVFFHVLNDFLMQGCLADLKQREWWEKQVKPLGYTLDKTKYRHDYKSALLAHGFLWSVTMMLPLFWMLWQKCPDALCVAVVLNTLFHAYVDDLKANKFRINLWQDQVLHLVQIFVTFLAFRFIG